MAVVVQAWLQRPNLMSGYVAPDVEAQQPATAAPVASGSMSTPQPSANADASILAQSSHPVALIFLYLFRTLAIVTYLLCGFLSSSYVLSTVCVVVLLSADFWTVRNVSGRVLVGLRFWNQVDEDGTSYWVFESRDPSMPSNAVDSKSVPCHRLHLRPTRRVRMFWLALYAVRCLRLSQYVLTSALVPGRVDCAPLCGHPQIQHFLHPHRRAGSGLQRHECNR
jgi:hypothetical protein